ncbi:MAG: cation-transporting P-type ATPase [Oscillospiraceae bacterium]|nr:cation-transporting P-type ATPase [Oscillospiraceae bacterium]
MTFSGLSVRESEAAKQKYGSNELSYKLSFGNCLLHGFGSLTFRLIMIAVLIQVILVLLGLLGYAAEYPVYKAAVLLGAAVAYALAEGLMRYRAENTLNSLCRKAASGEYFVFRENGKAELVHESELTVGDAVYLAAGDVVPADGIMADGAVTVDLSRLGIAKKAEKSVPPMGYRSGIIEPETPYSLCGGAEVCGGSGVMRITAIGGNTYAAKKREGAEQIYFPDSEFSGMNRVCGIIGAAFAAGIVILSAVYTAWYRVLPVYILHGLSCAALVLAVSCAGGRSVLFRFAAANTVKKLWSRDVRVSNPGAMISAAETDILFTEKCGFISENSYTVSGFIDGSGKEYAKFTEIDGKLGKLAKMAVINCCSAVPGKDGTVIGRDGFDCAMLGFVSPYSSRRDVLKKQAETRYDKKNRLSGATVSLEGRMITIIRGGAEFMLKKCSEYYGGDGQKQRITNKDALSKLIDAISLTGKDVTAFAVSDKSIKNGALPDGGCTLIGFMALQDSYLDNSEEAVKALKSLGVQTILVTEASRENAIFTVKRSKIKKGSGVIISSEQLEKMSDKELSERLSDIKAVVRATSGDKRRLLRIAHEKGMKVCTAMLGTEDISAYGDTDLAAASVKAAPAVRAFGDVSVGGIGATAALMKYLGRFISGVKAALCTKSVCEVIAGIAAIASFWW